MTSENFASSTSCRASAQLHALDEDLEVLHDLRLARIDVDLER